jgi:hypothetical protein
LQHLSATNSHKDLILNSTNRKFELDKINENHQENEDLDQSRPLMMIRSNSYVQVRDKEFFDMCLDEEEAANYEQNLFEAL